MYEVYPAYVSRLAQIAGVGTKTDQFKCLLANGTMSVFEIEARLGVSRQYSAIMRNGGANLSRPKSALANLIIRKIRASNGKKTYSQIAAECGTGEPYVSRVAAAYGIKAKTGRPKGT